MIKIDTGLTPGEAETPTEQDDYRRGHALGTAHRFNGGTYKQGRDAFTRGYNAGLDGKRIVERIVNGD